MSRGSLTLCCVKCTRARTFAVPSVQQAALAIAAAGWVQRDGQTICPKCPQTAAERKNRAHA